MTMVLQAIRSLLIRALPLVFMACAVPFVAVADELGPTERSPELEGLQWPHASDRYVSNGDVRLHYVTVGSGPLVVMIHGFPDYWYTWRNQIEALAEDHQVVAIDQRGYNLSGQPEGVEAYGMSNLVADVVS